MATGSLIKASIKLLTKVPWRKVVKYVAPIAVEETARRLKKREATLQTKLARLEKMKKKGKITHIEYTAMRKKVIEEFSVEVL